jgi:hypothetical protein
MTTRRIVTKMLTDGSPAELDPLLAAEGFRRTPNSLKYQRRLGDGTQHFDLVFDARPRYEPRALAHLLPQVRFVFPELNRRVLDMMGEMPTLEGANGVTFSQQLQNAAPRHVRTGDATRWFIFDSVSARACVVSLREFVQQWTIPFLNTYSTVAALTEGYEQQDERLPHDRRFWLFIAAAYTLLEQPSKAMQVLESRFGKAGSRQEYANAFEHVSSLLTT